MTNNPRSFGRPVDGIRIPLWPFCVLAAFFLTLGPGGGCVLGAGPEHEIKLATMAPENSSLMKIFREMNEELLKETGGKVGFKMYAGFVLGDEEDVLRKLRVGMIHAAAFTSTALTDLNPDLRVFQVPFLFSDYKEVDFVLGKMEADLKKGFANKGFHVLGWPEVGFIYFMSRVPISNLNDLKGKRVWAKSNAPMLDALIQKAGVSAVAINAPDVLVALQTNLLDVVYNSPYYAVVTQWYTQLKYVTNLPLSYIGGAVILDKKILAGIPGPLQETLRRVSEKHLRRVTEQTRKDNAESFQVILKRGVFLVTPTADEIEEFKKVGDEAVMGLDPKLFPKDVFKKVKGWLSEYRTASDNPQ